MADVEIKYNNSTIASLNDSGAEVLETNGTFLTDDITVEYTKSGGVDTLADFIENRNTFSSYENSSISKIDDYAFYRCSNLTTVSFPSCTSIGSSAFYSCSKLTTVSFPLCTSIRSHAFDGCYSLTTASFPLCTIIDWGAFDGCSNLTTISFPSCTSIGSSAFYSCSKLTTVSFPLCTIIGSYAFYNCQSLTTVSFPLCSYISGSAFTRCFRLTSLYLLGSSVVRLSYSNTFSYTPIAGYTTYTGGVYGSIYVQSSLYSSYIASTNWSYFSSRFVSV